MTADAYTIVTGREWQPPHVTGPDLNCSISQPGSIVTRLNEQHREIERLRAEVADRVRQAADAALVAAIGEIVRQGAARVVEERDEARCEVERLRAEHDASAATDEEVRAVLAEYTAKIDAAIEKGKTNLACHWCGEVADVTDHPAVDKHYRTCTKSPLVIEIARLRALLVECEPQRPVQTSIDGAGLEWTEEMERDYDVAWAAYESLCERRLLALGIDHG